MRGTKNSDLDGGTRDIWPSLTADVDRLRSDEPSLEQLVETLVDKRMAVANGERNELKKEARWMGVRVLTLEQSLKKSREENEALSQYLQLCFDEVRAQDDRLSPRLATLEGEVLALSSRSSKVDADNIELRQETREALVKLDALTSELFELVFDAKSVAVGASGSADAAASKIDELVLGASEARKQVTSLEGRTDAIWSDLEDTVAAAEFLAAGLTDAAEATMLAHAAAQEARKQADGIASLSDELRADLEQRTQALRDELGVKASVEDLSVLETADRERVDALRVDLEVRTQVLVDEISSKASVADLQSLETADRERVDALRADLEERTQALRAEIDGKASLEDLEVLEEADRFLLAADDVLSDELRAYLEQNTAALRKEIARKAPAKKLRALEEADLALANELRADLEVRTQVLVEEISSKASVADLQSLETTDRERVAALHADLERRTEALNAAIASLASAEDVRALEEADRVLEEELKTTSELTEEVRVMAEKAESRAEYASDATDELRADFDELPEGQGRPQDGVTKQEASEALDDLRSEVTSSLEALRSRVDERLNGYVIQADDSTVVKDLAAVREGRHKRWHAHLRGPDSNVEETVDSPKALPSET